MSGGNARMPVHHARATRTTQPSQPSPWPPGSRRRSLRHCVEQARQGALSESINAAKKRRRQSTEKPTSVVLNPLESRGNYTATSNNIKWVHWPLMGGLLHLVQRVGDWAGSQPAQAPFRCTKCNIPPINGQCTKLPITILLYNGLLICGFNGPTCTVNDI